MTIAVDANVVVGACTVDEGLARFGHEELVAPPLMWSEARSALHVGLWRGQLTSENARLALQLVEHGPVREQSHPRLGQVAWELADRLGWAKTYDAEYLALASLLGCRLATLDARLARAADRLGIGLAAI